MRRFRSAADPVARVVVLLLVVCQRDLFDEQSDPYHRRGPSSPSGSAVSAQRQAPFRPKRALVTLENGGNAGYRNSTAGDYYYNLCRIRCQLSGILQPRSVLYGNYYHSLFVRQLCLSGQA